jgi:multiple sugar transport system ATP-binding protein
MLEVAAIEKRFGALHVLKAVTIEARAGEFLVLLGPSGCGKSTLLNIIAGLEDATAGDVMIGGQRVTDFEPKDRDIAMVFQSYALYPSMTVAENLSFGMKVRGVPRSERTKAVSDVAKVLKLDALLDRKPSQLSGGQRQRVAMGRALVRHPKIFLFDEPLSNLDAQLRVEMRTELKKLHARLKATIVYVTHDQVEAMTLATKVVVMEGGVVQQVGAPQEIYDRPANSFVAKFIGSPSMNLFPAELAAADSAMVAKVKGPTGDKPILLRTPAPNGDVAVGKQVLCGIRPEAILPVQAEAPAAANVLPVDIEIVEPTGSDNIAFFRLGTSEILARLPPGSCSAGDKLLLQLPEEKLLIYDAESGRLLF